jgi:hypothetical protein
MVTIYSNQESLKGAVNVVKGGRIVINHLSRTSLFNLENIVEISSSCIFFSKRVAHFMHCSELSHLGVVWIA